MGKKDDDVPCWLTGAAANTIPKSKPVCIGLSLGPRSGGGLIIFCVI